MEIWVRAAIFLLTLCMCVCADAVCKCLNGIYTQLYRANEIAERTKKHEVSEQQESVDSQRQAPAGSRNEHIQTARNGATI